MFDNNPFREFKQMMKKKLSEATKDGGVTKETIRDRINSHNDSSELLAALQSDPEFAGHVGNDPDHLHHVLHFVQGERDDEEHKPGTPFNAHHDKLINFVVSSPSYDRIQHAKRIDAMANRYDERPVDYGGPGGNPLLRVRPKRLEPDPTIDYEG